MMKKECAIPKKSLSKRLLRDLRENGGAYVLVLVVVAYYILFHYKPMGGAVIAFKNFSPRKGIWGSAWVGFKHFEEFFNSYYFGRTIKNTLVISLSSLIFSFPLPILFALSINEVKLFTDGDSFIVQIMTFFGYENTGASLLNDKVNFVPIYIISGIWQNLGWDCIIYLAALTAIDPALYEAARVDGANRLRQTIHVTLPGIAGTIVMLLILRIGSLMNVGYEKIILLYNERIYETADVISSYVYRRGLIQGDWSFGSAVGLFNSVINFVLVLSANALSKKIAGFGLW